MAENDIDIFGDWLLEEVWHASMNTPRSYPGSHDLEGQVLEILGLVALTASARKKAAAAAPSMTQSQPAPTYSQTKQEPAAQVQAPSLTYSQAKTPQPTISTTHAPVTSSSAPSKMTMTSPGVTPAQAASAKAALEAAGKLTMQTAAITAAQAAAAKAALANTITASAVSKAAAQAAAKAARDVAAAGNRLVAASRRLDKKLPSFAKKAAGKGQSVVRKSTTIKGEVVVGIASFSPTRFDLPGEGGGSGGGGGSYDPGPTMQMQQLDPTAWHNYQILAGVTNAVAQATEMADAVYTLGQKLPAGLDALTTEANDLIDRCSAVNDAFDPNADPPDGSLIGIVQVIGLDVADWTSRAKAAVLNPAAAAAAEAATQTGAPAGTGAFDPGTAGGGGGGGSSDGEEPAGGGAGGSGGGGDAGDDQNFDEEPPMEDSTPASDSESVQRFRDSGGEWDPFADEGGGGGGYSSDDSGEAMQESTADREGGGDDGFLLPDERDAHATLAAFRESGGAVDPLADDSVSGDAGGMGGMAGGGMSGGGYDSMFSSLAKDAGGIGEAAQGKKREKANIVTDILNPLNLITVAIESGGNKDDAMIRWGLQEAPPGPEMRFITVKTTRPDGTTAQDRMLAKDVRKLALARKKMLETQQKLDAWRAAQATAQQPESVLGKTTEARRTAGLVGGGVGAAALGGLGAWLWPGHRLAGAGIGALVGYLVGEPLGAGLATESTQATSSKTILGVLSSAAVRPAAVFGKNYARGLDVLGARWSGSKRRSS